MAAWDANRREGRGAAWRVVNGGCEGGQAGVALAGWLAGWLASCARVFVCWCYLFVARLVRMCFVTVPWVCTKEGPDASQ